MMSAAVTIDHLTKRYGSATVLDDLTLEVREGEMLALLGHNGAGKTTLMKVLLGLTHPTGGTLSLLGNTGGATADVRREIGFLPENVSFVGGMTGNQALAFYARLRGVDPGNGHALLSRVGLADDAARRPVRTYSKGMRQRLGLAQALLGRPRLLLLDEPTSGLDPVLRQAFYDILRDLRDQGTTVLISSHILTELELRADRIAILRQGRLVACDTLDGLRRAAGLPVRIKVTVPEGRTADLATSEEAHGKVLSVNGRHVELTVEPAAKMAMLRRLIGSGIPVEDIDIVPPNLEQVYARLGGSQETTV